MLSRLENVKKKGEGWTALCPAHKDSDPSLHIDLGEDGRVLLKCFAGCETADIVAAIGLELKDLFPPKNRQLRPQARQGGGQIIATYDYFSPEGELLYQVCRTAEKKFFQRRPMGQGWANGLGGMQPVLYKLPELIRAVQNGDLVFIPEGEKDVNNLTNLGLAATTSPMGAGKWRDYYSDHLAGANCVILPDNDKAGLDHAEKVARSLQDRAASVKVLLLPGLGEKGDVSDWLTAGGTVDKLLALAAEAGEWKPGPVAEAEEEEEDEKLTQAQILIQMAQGVELFHTPGGEEYASVLIGGHLETWPIKSKRFRQWLLRRFYTQQGKPPGGQALQDALNQLEAKASLEGEEVAVALRTTELDGKIYIDLANSDWEAVEIDCEGWRIKQNPPVKFRRTQGLQALPKPITGGKIEDLRQFVNAPGDSEWQLLVAWLIAALRPTGPYPLLVLQGEQGSAKSTTARVLRELVDPSLAVLRSTPRNEQDLAIAAYNAWVLAYDNLSGVPGWLSDALCRTATGGGFSTRELYSDKEETILDYARPVILTGIDEIISRNDLVDRSLIVTLPPIPEDKRQDEQTFWAAFNKAKPGILGALLDAVAVAQKNISSVKLDKQPRMADFARWLSAAEPALPWGIGEFMAAYGGNRADAIELALEDDHVAVAVRSLLQAEGGAWEGTATELLRALNEHTDERTQKAKRWPKTARTLSNRLRQAAPFLRRVGIETENFRGGDKKGTRLIRISKQTSVSSVSSVRQMQESPTAQDFRNLTQEGSFLTQQPFSDASGILASEKEPLVQRTSDNADATDVRKPTCSNGIVSMSKDRRRVTI